MFLRFDKFLSFGLPNWLSKTCRTLFPQKRRFSWSLVNMDVLALVHLFAWMSTLSRTLIKLRLQLAMSQMDLFNTYANKHKNTHTPTPTCIYVFKGTVTQIEKALINNRLYFSKMFWKFHVPTIYNFAVIYPWNLLFS